MQRRYLPGLSVFFLIVYLYMGVTRVPWRPFVDLPDVPGGLVAQMLVLLLSALTHALYALGWRHALIFLALSATISWTYEQIGVATALIYGPYHYTDVLGVKLGYVPIVIPLAWFMMIYPSYVVTNCMLGDPPIGSRGGFARIIWTAFLSAMVMTSWALLIDPHLSGPEIRAWVWEQGGPYFGIPLQNYAGWMLTTFSVYAVYRLFEWRVSPRPLGSLTRILASPPLAAYALLLLSGSVGSGPPALLLIGPFVMGMPLLIAITRLWFEAGAGLGFSGQLEARPERADERASKVRGRR